MSVEKVNIAEKLNLFTETWTPKIVGELNEQYVKLAKLKGEFVMHAHENEDEMFLVVSGTLFIELPDKTLEMGPGEFAVIPKGVPHKPYAPEEVSVMLFEPKSTVNTGQVESDLTAKNLDRI